MNISDPRFEIPGIVEFSNLRPTGDTVVYIPYYMPATHPKFARDDAFFRAEGFGYLQLLNPALRESDVVGLSCRAAAPRAAGLSARALPRCCRRSRPRVAGLQIADTCFYYPEDRGISESVRFGKLMAERVP